MIGKFRPTSIDPADICAHASVKRMLEADGVTYVERWRCYDCLRTFQLVLEGSEVLEKVTPLDHQRCPHRWQAHRDNTTTERVVYCELCGWEYSREAIRG